jgi:hypothetical protein
MEVTYSSETSVDFQRTGFVCYLLSPWFLVGVVIDPEDGGDMLIRNVG